MTKGLHKNSLRKVDNPHQWMIDDARMELIQQIKAEIERQREEIRPTDTGEMKVVGTPTQLEQGWLNALSWMEKTLDTLQEQPVKELLTFDGFVDKVGSWFANLELRRFRKTFDGEIYPATELVQAYEWFVHELSEKYREKHPQEQPVCEGLEEEVKAWHKKHFKSRNAWEDYSGHYLDKNSQLDLARHFYELGRQSKPKPMEGLEEEIDKRYLQARVVGYQDGVGEILLGRGEYERIARHFAKWGAEHLKK